MKRFIIFATVMIATAAFVSCGGANMNKEKRLKDKALENTPDDYTPVSAILGSNPQLDTAGVDDTDTGGQEVAGDATIPQDQDYVGGTMAVFLPTVVANGEEIKATYKIAEATNVGTVVMQDLKSGQEVEVAPGMYDITFTTKAVAGDPEMTLRGIELVQGRRIRRQVKFPVGEITLVSAGGGCKSAKIQLKLKDSSDWMSGSYSTCKPIKLMAGEYIAKQGTIEITGIIVYDGGTRKVTIRNQ